MTLSERLEWWQSLTPEQRAAEEKDQAERRAQQAKQENASRAAQMFESAQIPKRHAACRVSLGGEWGERLKTITTLVVSESAPLIALVGTRGNGKTQLGVECIRFATGEGKTGLFTTATNFFIRIKATFKRDSETDEADVLREFSKPFLLVIDEIGKRGGTDWENNLLFELLNQRYNAMRPTIIIDNREVKDFIETIGPSLASRMSEGGGIFDCKWQTFRGA